MGSSGDSNHRRPSERGGRDGTPGLLRDPVGRRLRRRPRRAIRVGRTRRGGPRLHQRSRTLGRYPPPRPQDVRGAPRVGDDAHRPGPARAHPRVRRPLALDRQGRVLDDARCALERANPDRANLRRRRRQLHEGVRRARPRRRWADPGGPGVRGRSRRRVSALPCARRRGRRHAVASRGPRPAPRTPGRATVRERLRLPPLPVT